MGGGDLAIVEGFVFLKKIVLLSELSAGCFAHGQSMRGVFHCDLFFFFFQVQNWGFSLPQGIGLCPNRTINISLKQTPFFRFSVVGGGTVFVFSFPVAPYLLNVYTYIYIILFIFYIF